MHSNCVAVDGELFCGTHSAKQLWAYSGKRTSRHIPHLCTTLNRRDFACRVFMAPTLLP